MDHQAYGSSSRFRADVYDKNLTNMRAPKIPLQLPQTVGGGAMPMPMQVPVVQVASNSGVMLSAPLNSLPMHTAAPYYSNQPIVHGMEAAVQVKPPSHTLYQQHKPTSVQNRLNRDCWVTRNPSAGHNLEYSISQMPAITPTTLDPRLHLTQIPGFADLQSQNQYTEGLMLPTPPSAYPTSADGGSLSHLDATTTQYHCHDSALASQTYMVKPNEKPSTTYSKEYASTSSTAIAAVHPKEDACSAVTTAEVDDHAALSYLQMAIQCLDENPGQLDAISTQLNSILKDKANNDYVLSVAMEDIFVEALEKSNFRYMGAKLYILLQKLNTSANSVFNQLMQRKLDHHREELANMVAAEKYDKTCATVLFLAELYMQMNEEKFDVNLLATDIVYFLGTLIVSETPANIRCVCLCLKLVGYNLSRDQSMVGSIQGIIEKLQRIDQDSPNKYPIISSVINLQKNNWGRDVSPVEEKDEVANLAIGSINLNQGSTSSAYAGDVDEPVFYGPDGFQISAEECEFLTQHAEESEFQNPDNYVIIDCVDPEQDPETRDDYRSFLNRIN